MIRAITFDKQLMKSEDFAHQVNYFYQGKMGVTKGCEISQDADGNIVISDGYFSVYGRYLKIEGDEVIEVPDIPSGTLYSILVFEIDLSQENTIDEFNQGRFRIISDASDYLELIQEDLDNGGTIYQMEFCRFENTVAGISNLLDTRIILSLEMYTMQDDFNDLKQDHETHLAESAQKHITESGSNDDGYYIRYDDGTQICWQNYQSSWTNIQNKYNMVALEGTPTWGTEMLQGSAQHPSPFVGTPASAISGGRADSPQAWVQFWGRRWETFYATRGSVSSGMFMEISLIAIGRWK